MSSFTRAFWSVRLLVCHSCRRCARRFCLCGRCDAGGRAYCSEECTAAGRTTSKRAARQRYAHSFAGQCSAAKRSQARRDKKIVTDQCRQELDSGAVLTGACVM